MKSPENEPYIYTASDLHKAQNTSFLVGFVLGLTLMAMVAALAISIALQ
jgi:tetrahydromethanopterin S-methyltransferase subunit B